MGNNTVLTVLTAVNTVLICGIAVVGFFTARRIQSNMVDAKSKVNHSIKKFKQALTDLELEV